MVQRAGVGVGVMMVLIVGLLLGPINPIHGQSRRSVGPQTPQASETDRLYGILEAMVRDLQAEMRELRGEMADHAERTRAQSQGLAEQVAVLEREREETRARLDGMTVGIGPCEERRQNTVYQAATAGFVVAAMDTGPNGDDNPRSGVVLFVAPDPESLTRPIDRQYMRGGASVQYRGLDTYLIHDGLTAPVGQGEYWTVLASYGNPPVSTEFRFCGLELSVE